MPKGTACTHEPTQYPRLPLLARCEGIQMANSRCTVPSCSRSSKSRSVWCRRMRDVVPSVLGVDPEVLRTSNDMVLLGCHVL